jgi:hypothetical protein
MLGLINNLGTQVLSLVALTKYAILYIPHYHSVPLDCVTKDPGQCTRIVNHETLCAQLTAGCLQQWSGHNYAYVK